MLSFLNKKLKFLLIVVLAVIGISFIFFGQWSTGAGRSVGGNATVAKIEGKNITYKDFFAEQQASRIIYSLQTGQQAPDGAQAEQVFRMQTWNRMLVLAAAKKSGIKVGEDQALEFIAKHPIFKDQNGQFSEQAFKFFKENILQPRGIDQKRFINIVREQMVYEQMIQNIAGTTVVQPSDVEQAVDKLYGKASLQYVEVSEDAIRKSLKPTDQELLAYYNANAAEYAVPETRSVEYVKFQLDAKQAALKGEERAAAMRELSRKAYEFTNPFFSAYDTKSALPDFKAAAAKAGLSVIEVKPFAKTDSIIDKDAGKHLAVNAFALSDNTPVSDYLQVENGFIVLHLTGSIPGAAKPFETVRAEVLKKYTDYLAMNRLLEQAKAVSAALRADLTAGKTWQQAVADQKLKAQSLPDFVPTEAKPNDKIPLLERAVYVAEQLEEGTVSEPVRSPNGAAIFYLAKRVKPSEKQVAEVQPAILKQVEQIRRQQTVSQWINSLLTSPKTHIPQEALFGTPGNS